MEKTKSINSILSNAQATFVRGETANFESVWVYACVRAIANNIASVPFRLKDLTGKVLTDPKDPWVALFSKPNPVLNSIETLWQNTVTNYELRGEVYWLFNDANLKPANKRPVRIDVVQNASAIYSPTNNKVQIGWQVEGNIYTLNNCIRFAQVSPSGGVQVISSKVVANAAVKLDGSINDYNQIFFDNGAQINGYLLDDSGEGALDNSEIKAIRNDWDAQYSGKGNAHKTPVLTGGLKYVATGTPHKDMEFPALKSSVKEEILAAFGVPASQISVGNSTYASAKIEDRQFFTNNLIPKMNLFVSVLNNTILALTGYKVEFDYSTIEPLKEERSAKLQGAKDLYELGYALNEINTIQKLGMNPVADSWANEASDSRALKNSMSNTTQANKPEPTNANQQVAQDNLHPKPKA